MAQATGSNITCSLKGFSANVPVAIVDDPLKDIAPPLTHTVPPIKLIHTRQALSTKSRIAILLSSTSRHIIPRTHIRCLHQNRLFLFRQMRTTAKANSTTSLRNSKPTILQHTTTKSDSRKSKPLRDQLRPNNSALTRGISTRKLRVVQLKHTTLHLRHQYNNTLFNNTSPLHRLPLAGRANSWLKNDSDLVSHDTQPKKKSRRHDEHTSKPHIRPITRGPRLIDGHLLSHCMTARPLAYVLSRNVSFGFLLG